MGLKESLDEPVSHYASAGFARVRGEDTVAEAARAMMNAKSTEAVVDPASSSPGIITERDIVYKVAAAGRDPAKTKVKEIMSAPMETIDSASKVSDAIAVMSKLGLRRLGVTKDGKLTGIVTQMAMVSGASAHSVPLPELTAPSGLRCPYCDAVLKDRNELSKHIDQLHLGLGLLEGDKSKW